jgi:hypothetical protein
MLVAAVVIQVDLVELVVLVAAVLVVVILETELLEL